MKTNFRKTLAVLLAVLMLSSVFSVTVFAAVCTATLDAGTAEGSTLKAELEDGTPITSDMLSIQTNSSGKFNLPGEAYFEREDYVQDGWTKTAKGTGTVIDFGKSQTIKSATKFYPHWKQVVFSATFGAGNNYDEADPNNYTDASMTELKELVIKTDGTDAQKIIFPDAMFTRDGYVQTGWCTTKSNNGTGTKYDFGSEYTGNVTKDLNFYPFWEALVYDVNFVGGADGVGTAQSVEVAYNKTTKAPDAIFTRENYTQIGWATTENSDVVELALNATTPKIIADVTYYPVWRFDIFAASVDVNNIKFGTSCIDYSNPGAQEVVITNDGNSPLEFVLPEVENYNIEVVNGSLSLDAGKTVTISIEPVAGLAIGDYSKEIVIACNKSIADVKINVSFKVVDHSFGSYKSNNDGTYTKDGTKTAKCLNGCGATDTIADPGSMKVYSADNNDAAGLQDSYIHHRTVRFTAYGSGMDAAEEDKLTSRFRPVSWYVNDEFNGEFENGYDVTFTHTLYGEYTLTINYVEETFDEETKEWVATEVTDTKTFDYTVGATAEEEQEIIRPNTILSILFGLFAELFKLLGIDL